MYNLIPSVRLSVGLVEQLVEAASATTAEWPNVHRLELDDTRAQIERAQATRQREIQIPTAVVTRLIKDATAGGFERGFRAGHALGSDGHPLPARVALGGTANAR